MVKKGYQTQEEAMKYLLILLFTLVLCATAGGEFDKGTVGGRVAIGTPWNHGGMPDYQLLAIRDTLGNWHIYRNATIDSITARLEVLEGEIHFPGYRIYPWVMFSVFCMWLILVILNAVLKAFEVHK